MLKVNVPPARRFYKLVDRMVLPCDAADTRAQVLYRNDINRCQITTTFLTVDLAEDGAPPQLFSTLIVPNEGEGVKVWYSGSWEEATTRHARAERLVRDNLHQGALDYWTFVKAAS